MHLTVKSTKKMAFSSHQAKRKRNWYPGCQPYCGKKRRNKYVYPSEWRFLRQSHALWISGNTYYSQVTTKLPWKAFAFRGSLCFTSMQLVLLQSVFQLAVERFGLYMLLQGLGRIYTAQRAVEPLSLYGGVGGESSTGRCHSVVSRLRSAGQ